MKPPSSFMADYHDRVIILMIDDGDDDNVLALLLRGTIVNRTEYC